MEHRFAIQADARTLAQLNRRLIQDEGHRNPMTLPELERRMRGWLDGEYTAVIFEQAGVPVAYALYRPQEQEIYLRQFYVERERRRSGLGREAMQTLLGEVWPRGARITVEVLVGNQAGLAFWKALGFKDYALTLEMQPEGKEAPVDA